MKGQYFLRKVNLEGKEIADLRRIQQPSRLYTLFLFEQHFFLGDYNFAGSWHRLETGEELWRIPKLGQVESRPVLQDDVLILSIGNSTDFFLIAVDAESGNELWRTGEVFGANVIWHKSNLYGLRTDATLVKLNFATGQIEAEIPFRPASTQPERWAYWLASDGERLFVYFGDSQELFALKTP